MSSIDQQFVEYIVKSIVGSPDAVEINRTVDERGVLLELTVSPDDLGRVIGKRGSGAQAIRTLLRALGTKNDARYNLKIVDNDAPVSPDNQAHNQSDNDANNAQSQEEPAENSDDNQSQDQSEESDSYGINESSEDSDEEETQQISKSEQTRKELADLDDLDI